MSHPWLSRAPTSAARLDRASLPVMVVPAVTVVALGCVEGGFFVGAQALAFLALAWLLAMITLVRDSVELSRLELVFAGGLVAFAGWVALSSSWSGDVSLSLREAQRVLLYLVAILVVAGLSTTGTIQHLLGGVLLAVVAIVFGGLAQYLFSGERLPDTFESYLLFRPVGYANALGILCAIGLILSLGFAASSPRGWVRPLAAAAVPPLSAALYLTASRGAWLALVLGLVVVAVLDRELPSSVTALGAAGGLVAVLLASGSGVADGSPGFDVDAARTLGLWLVVLTAVIAFGARAVSTRATTGWGHRRRSALAFAALVSAVIVSVAVVLGGNAGDLSLGDRPDYWRAAWGQWRESPALGGGAGAFGAASQRDASQGPRDAHSLYLETLAELGLPGLAILVGGLLVPVAAGVRARRKELVPVALGSYAAFLAHAGIDWDWEMPVVTLAGLFCGAALLVASRDLDPAPVRLRLRPWPLVVAAVLVALAVADVLANRSGRLH